MKKERDPTKDEYEKLLLWFDSDRNKAGAELKMVQTRLIRIFISRGCADADALADEVINRVSVRIDKVSKTFPNPLLCCVAFVDNVHHEYLRERKRMEEAIPPPPPRSAEELEKEDQCLAKCMAERTEAERYFVLCYFQGEKGVRRANRKKLSKELKLPPNTLRSQAHRLRITVQRCLQECLDTA